MLRKLFELQFIENNAESFWLSSNKVLNNLKVNIIIYSFLLLFAMLFTVYMYMEIYKNSYAIERILGVTHRSASRYLLIPLYIFTTIGIGLSSYFGYQTAIKNSKKILEEILGKLPCSLDFSINIKFIFPIFLTIAGVFVIQSLLMVLRLKNRSLLEFFRNKNKENEMKGKKLAVVDFDITDSEFSIESLTDVLSSDDLSINVGKGKEAIKGYGKKHIFRSILTTTLMVVVTGLLVGTLTWLINVIELNKDFIDKTISKTTIFGKIEYVGEAKFSFKGDIPEVILDKILKTGLVEDYFAFVDNEYSEINIDRSGIIETIQKDVSKIAYYERYLFMTVLASNKELNSDNGIKLSGVEDQSIIDKFNSYTLTQDEIPILASTVAMDTYNLKIGDKVSLKDAGLNYPDVYGTIVGTFETYGLLTYDVYCKQQFLIPRNKVFETFIFPLEAVRLIVRNGINYVKIDLIFDKEKNKELYYNREEILNQVAKTNSGESTGFKLVIYGEKLTETIRPLEKNLELLSIIYPIILVLSLLIGVALPYLLILRRSEELSIMRVLGVKEVEIKGYVFGESLLLIIVGEIIAIAVINVVTFKSGIYPIWKYLLIIVGYLLASIIGILVSLKNVLYKKPLEMLHVKE